MRALCNRPYALLKRGIMLLSLGLTACSSIPPFQEMSDARQAIQAAREAEADKYFPAALYCAERQIQIAEQQLEASPDDYSYARFNALAAKESAIHAREITENLLAARKTLRRAVQSGHSLPEAENLLARAEEAVRLGNIALGLELAGQARQLSENALLRAQLEKTGELIRQAEAQAARLTPEEQAVLRQARAALARQDAAEALQLLDTLREKLQLHP